MAGREPGTWWRQIGPLFTAGRGVATGRGLGEEEAAQAETIYLEHEEQLGREASSAAFQGQVGREEGMPSAKAASSPCLLPPTFPAALESGPAVAAQSRAHVSSPHSQAPAWGYPSQWDSPPDCRFYLLLNVYCARHRAFLSSDGYVRWVCSPLSRGENREVISNLSRAARKVGAVEGT